MYIDEAARLGVRTIGLTGGEPLMNSSLEYIIKYIGERGMLPAIATNGAGLSEKRLDSLIKVGLKYTYISLNGSNKEIHERSRNGYYGTIKAIELLCKKGTDFGINWVARKDNVEDFPNIVQLAEENRVDQISILRLKPDLNGEMAQGLEREHLIKLAEYIGAHRNKSVVIKVSRCFSMLRSLLYENNNSLYAGCRAGRLYMAIDVDGNFLPCRLMSHKEKYSSISDYWLNSKVLKKLRSIEENIESPCNECAKLSNCRTCRVISEKLYGNIFAGERYCPIFEGNRNNEISRLHESEIL